MSDRKFTPGPWVWNKGAAIHGKGYGIIATNDCGRNDNYDPETADANIQLIAAAPELLEALEDLVNEIWDGADPDDFTYFEHAQSAIKKALGESK